MRKYLTFLFSFFIFQSYAQEKTITIDYVVDYAIPSEQNNTIDTISIGFNKEGKYLWTDYNQLALSLASSLIQNSSTDYSNAKSNIIYDTEAGTLILMFELEKNQIFFNLDLDSFLPMDESNADDETSMDLITEDTGETIQVLNKNTKVYNMFPGSQPDDVVTMAMDQDYPVNNTTIFKKFFEIAFQKSGFKDEASPNIPEGLIMKIFEKDKTMIEATKVDTNKKTIKINYSFKITG